MSQGRPGDGADDADQQFAELEACVQRIARERDQACYGRLAQHCYPALLRFFRRRREAARFAEDCAQETLLAVWRKAALFDPSRGPFPAWCFTLARNIAVDLERTERRQQRIVVEGQLHVPEWDQPAVEAMIRAEDEAQVLDAMRSLAAGDAELLDLHYREDLSHAQISAHTGRPLGTVKSGIRRAVDKLRVRLTGGADG